MQDTVPLQNNKPTLLAKYPFIVFVGLWVLSFILYFPAAKAGKAGDYFIEWLEPIRTHSFWYFIHPPNFPSVYYFTQTVMYLYYQLFGEAPWPWHILSLTIHVLNAFLLYRIFSRLCNDAEIKNSPFISLGTAVLFCFSPYNTEVVVHEPCFHYTQGFLCILLVLLLVQKFTHKQQIRYAWLAAIIFFLSSYAIEVFYLTPIFVLLFAAYYYSIRRDRHAFKATLLYFIIPEAAIFLIHLAVLYSVTHHAVGHDLYFWIADIHTYFITRVPKYLFHLLFFGRFLQDMKPAVYMFFNSPAGIYSSTFAIVIVYLTVIIFFKRMGNKSKLLLMMFTWTLLSIAIVSLLGFPDIQYIALDRYTYFMMPFAYMSVLLLASYSAIAIIRFLILGVYIAFSLVFIIKLNNYWHNSAMVIQSLQRSFPVSTNKIVLLLNIPENMNGAQMIGSWRESSFKRMYNLENAVPITAPVYDIASYNMQTPNDGAHIMVINDSVLHVTLNQWGAWWWFNYLGAVSRANSLYKLNMIDVGHWYELTLRHPVSEYLLLYSVGGQWKEVDWSKNSVDQY